MKRIKTIFCITLILPICTHARTCNIYEYDKAEYLANAASHELIDSAYGGGRNITMDIISCDYNTYADIFKVKTDIYWSGAYFSSHRYNVEGVLKFSSSGGKVDFSETYASPSVKKFKFYTGAAVVTVAIGAAVYQSNK